VVVVGVDAECEKCDVELLWWEDSWREAVVESDRAELHLKLLQGVVVVVVVVVVVEVIVVVVVVCERVRGGGCLHK
jgi:hypothetical protein